MLAVAAVWLAVACRSAQAAPPFDVSRYDITLRIEPEERLVRGSATAAIVARAKLSRATFALNELLQVKAIQRDDSAARFERGERVAEGRAVTVVLEPALAPGDSCRLTFQYEGQGLDPDEGGADWMGTMFVRPDEVRMSHQAQWYPIVPRDERARRRRPRPPPRAPRSLHLVGGRTRTLTLRPAQLVQPWQSDVSGKVESVGIDPRVFVLFQRAP